MTITISQHYGEHHTQCWRAVRSTWRRPERRSTGAVRGEVGHSISERFDAMEMADPISSVYGNMCANRRLANAGLANEGFRAPRGAASRRRNERQLLAAGGRHRDR